jgi:hypothetical protein
MGTGKSSVQYERRINAIEHKGTETEQGQATLKIPAGGIQPWNRVLEEFTVSA